MDLFLYTPVEYGSGFQNRTTSDKYSIFPQVTSPGSQFTEFSLWHFQVSHTLQLLLKHTRAVQVWRPLPLLWHLFPLPDKQPQHIEDVPSCRPQVDSTDHWTYGEALRSPPVSVVWWRIALTFDAGFQEVLKNYHPKTILAALLWKSGQTWACGSVLLSWDAKLYHYMVQFSLLPLPSLNQPLFCQSLGSKETPDKYLD